MSSPSRNRLKRTPLPRAFGRAFELAARVQVARWDMSLRNVRKTQLAQLRAIVEHSKYTEFGRRHGFADIRNEVDFRQSVPIGDYDSFSPYIDRMRQGESGLLVPEFVRHFGNSSGSSTKGKSKFLPITDRQVKLQRAAGADALFRFLLHQGVGDFPSGFSLGLFPPITMREEGPVKITSNPALMVATLPKLTKLAYLPEDDILLMSDYDQKLGEMASRYLDHDVRLISGTTCWFSLLFDKLLEEARKRGRNVSSVSELWPNLTVLVGGGVAAGPYLDVIRDRVGRDIPLVDTYNATEGGIYASTDHANPGAGMLMLPHQGTYFEFVPVEELTAKRPTRLPLWEVQKDRVYAIVVTTVSGLYAYLLGDLVRFPSVDPPRIEFAGRLSGCLSTTQELTTHVEIQESVAAALAATGGKVVDFTAGADVGVDGSSKSRYVLFAEFAEAPPRDPRRFASAFDAKLCEVNRVYREHRNDNTAILPPEFVMLPEGSVARFMKDIGNVSVQSKFPRIVDDERRDILRSYGGTSSLA
ncbi:MAG TPA: GH3 auxin-responsive promoter family protein [Polyangiaceae bacterium]|nr:GH3 auxin-responsive promoter family protein [Polyangiaceae bacterium]